MFRKYVGFLVMWGYRLVYLLMGRRYDLLCRGWVVGILWRGKYLVIIMSINKIFYFENFWNIVVFIEFIY